MAQMVVGTYQLPTQPKRAGSATYMEIPTASTDGHEIALDFVEVLTLYSHHMSEKIRLGPVYVTEDTNELVYNSSMMEKGKKYFVTWYDEHFALIKGDDGVVVYRFEPEEKIEP